MVINIFGAYFGLAASMFFNPTRAIENRLKQNKASYFSNLIALVGTIFLFMYYPSFNAALADGMARQRSIVNTLVSISGSVMVAVYVSRVKNHKIDMQIIWNASLAGGVCMGACSDLIVNPGFAMLTGSLAGLISALGYLVADGWLRKTIGLHDTCGVQWLHGVPGIYGGIVSSICASCGYYNFGSPAQLSLMFLDVSTRSQKQQAAY